jgi:16S rRNA (guanine966-N2)-methyltransferase
VGLEALSRGALSVTFVERDAQAVAAIRANIDQLAPDAETTVQRQDALRFAGALARGAFDVVVADPPYDSDATDELIALFRAVPFGRILSVEHSARRTPAGDDTRRYGSTAITFCHAP